MNPSESEVLKKIDELKQDIRLFDGTYLMHESQKNEILSKIMNSLKSLTANRSKFLQPIIAKPKGDSKELIHFMTFIVLNNRFKKIGEENQILKNRLKFKKMNNHSSYMHFSRK